jgi:uncharacterized protein
VPYISQQYKSSADIPSTVPVFPLAAALLLPRGQLPLVIFEPRYLEMINSAMSADRLIGMIQPASEADIAMQDDPDLYPEIAKTGCVGRITSFTETGDGRILITLSGIARFSVIKELDCPYSYRICQIDCQPYVTDFTPGIGEDEVNREALLSTFKSYLSAHGLEADWESVHKSSNETLVNSLCIMSPYGPQEKQALLEAKDLKTRADILIALTEMELAQTTDDTDKTLQ